MTPEQIKYLGRLLFALRAARSYITYSGNKEETLAIIDSVLDGRNKDLETINKEGNKENNELH